jgi:hypothetical protein
MVSFGIFLNTERTLIPRASTEISWVPMRDTAWDTVLIFDGRL